MESKSQSVNETDLENSIHMQVLDSALKKTTNKCISAFKFSLFKRQFEPVYKKDPKTLQKLHEGAVRELNLNIQEELEMMFEEEAIGKFMLKLDELKAKADNIGEEVTAWRPCGVPSDDVRAHTHPVHCQHLYQLQKVFDQLQSQNTFLQRTLKKQHDKLMQSRSVMLSHLDMWKKANSLSADAHQEIENFLKDL